MMEMMTVAQDTAVMCGVWTCSSARRPKCQPRQCSLTWAQPTHFTGKEDGI